MNPTISNINKNQFTLYRNDGNNDIKYISTVTLYKNKVAVISGSLKNDAEFKNESHEFFSLKEARLFFENLRNEKELIYNYMPFFEHFKIEMDLSNHNEADTIVDIVSCLSQGLEEFLVMTGIGFILDDYYDEITNTNYYAFESSEDGLCSLKFFTLNKERAIYSFQDYLKEHELGPINFQVIKIN